MSPYLLLGFFIAGLLHVYVPKRFYAKYLSHNNKLSVLWAALLGVPLPLCSCGVIPTAVGLKKEGASKGAVASFLIATPQTGIDSILATFSLMGLGFAVVRPVAALVTGICGGLLVNRYVGAVGNGHETTGLSRPNGSNANLLSCCATASDACADGHDHSGAHHHTGSRLWRALRYAFYDMMQDIGLRLAIGLVLAAIISVAVPDEFFMYFAKQPLLQMAAVLVVAVPMYICSTGSIPVAAALIMKGLSPGAALVMLMAGPAVNIASILVVRKSMGSRFTLIYLLSIVGFSILFGMLVNAMGIDVAVVSSGCVAHDGCCPSEAARPGLFQTLCSLLLVLLIVLALSTQLVGKIRRRNAAMPAEGQPGAVYAVEGMHCSHCKAACEQAVSRVEGVTGCKANPADGTLAVTGTAAEADIRAAVEQAGFSLTATKK